jgi:serine/threonine protein kinase
MLPPRFLRICSWALYSFGLVGIIWTGLAVLKKSAKNAAASMQGSVLWMAPEIINPRGSQPYTVYSDVFAFGIILFEMFAGEMPYATRFQSLFAFSPLRDVSEQAPVHVFDKLPCMFLLDA